MATRSHLITAATALSLGLGLGALGINEVMAADYSRRVSVERSFPNSNGVITSIWNQVDAALCPDAEAAADLDPGTCSVETGTVISFTRGATRTGVSANFKFAGSWVLGSPQ